MELVLVIPIFLLVLFSIVQVSFLSSAGTRVDRYEFEVSTHDIFADSG